MILLKNATYINWETLRFTNGNIIVEEGPDGMLLFPGDANLREFKNVNSTLDCTGFLITRSFVNAHHHAYSTLARGMPPPLIRPDSFVEILKNTWWKLDRSLSPEMVRYSALVTAIASAKAGCTFIIDHHASPFAVKGSLSMIAEAFDEIGLGHLLCYEISDRDGEDIARKGLEETEFYLQHHQGLVGLHASFTLKKETLEKAVDLAGKYQTGIHIHAAEDPFDQEFTFTNYHKSVLERLEETGMLDTRQTLLAHCLHVSDKEREIIRRHRVAVVQNCESNLNNRVGFFSGEGMGENILLGTDGMHSDMIRSSQAAYFTGLNHEPMSPEKVYRRCRQAHIYLRNNNFTGDSANNLILLDYDSPTPVTPENFSGHFIYGLDSRHIRHVIAQGRWVIKDHILQTADEDKILSKARSLARRLWKKMKELP